MDNKIVFFYSAFAKYFFADVTLNGDLYNHLLIIYPEYCINYFSTRINAVLSDGWISQGM